MKLRFSTGVVVLALSANATMISTSAAAPDPVGVDLAGEARAAADAPATSWGAVDRPDLAQPGATTGAPKVLRMPSANPLWAVPLSTLSSTRERPIFSSSRRPPPSAVAPSPIPTAVAAPKPKAPERPQLALVGTIANGAERFGIFVAQSNAMAVRLKIGEDFQGWKLSSVQGREATLEKDQQVVVLTLPQPGSAQPAGPLTPQLQSVPQQRRRLQPNR